MTGSGLNGKVNGNGNGYGGGMLLGILPTNVKRKKVGEANDVSEKCTVMDVWHM